MIISVFDRVENILGKGENAGDQHFLLFPQCFEKASFPDTSKDVIVWEWVKTCECICFSCLAKVTAKNAINRVDSGTVEIHVIDKIQQLEIILHGSKYERLVNKTIRFHSFHFAGTNVTYTWDFGDGSAPVVTTKPDVNKTFHV